MSFTQQILASFKDAAGGVLTTPASLVTTPFSSNTTVLVSGSASPSASGLVMVATTWRGSGVKTILSVTSAFTTGGWTEAFIVNPDMGGPWAGLSVWWANYTSGTGAVTVTASSGLQRSTISVFETTGHNTTTPIINIVTGSIATGTTASVTLASPASNSITVGVMNQLKDSDNAITPGASFAELTDTNSGGSTPSQGQVEYDETTPGVTVDWSGLSGVNRAYAGFEIQAE